MIAAIDPGPTESGWVILDNVNRRVVDAAVLPNDLIRIAVSNWCDRLAIEMIASYGMPVGADVFATCVEIGRYTELHFHSTGLMPRLVTRAEVKTAICGHSRAKDSNIRRALMDLLGPPGTKADPGPTYGVKSHAWAALAVAVTATGIGYFPQAPVDDNTTDRNATHPAEHEHTEDRHA